MSKYPFFFRTRWESFQRTSKPLTDQTGYRTTLPRLSKSPHTATVNYDNENELINEILNLIHQAGMREIDITFAWIPDHVEPWNEEAVVHVVFSTAGFKGGGKSCCKTCETAVLRRGIQKASCTWSGSNPSHWCTSSGLLPIELPERPIFVIYKSHPAVYIFYSCSSWVFPLIQPNIPNCLVIDSRIHCSNCERDSEL